MNVVDEEAFKVAIDANPSDPMTRLVFADWLEERGDPRGIGYRALGELGLYPDVYEDIDEDGNDCGVRFQWWCAKSSVPHAELPYWWSNALGDRHAHRTRRDAEDAAAEVFGNMTAEEQASIMAEALATKYPPKREDAVV